MANNFRFGVPLYPAQPSQTRTALRRFQIDKLDHGQWRFFAFVETSDGDLTFWKNSLGSDMRITLL
jgi:hypothetical protein